ncbi:MAG: cysteine desulfurase [Ruminococcus flavefaciens]|nr:cysteine desulfurase [Ruminococcus flavefaciens]
MEICGIIIITLKILYERYERMSVYLDNASTTKPCREAVEAVMETVTENFGNPSSLHRAGLNAQLAVDRARKIIAGSVGADTGEIYFTSGATESNNLALRGAMGAYGKRKNKVVVSSVEHASVDETVSALEKQGFETVRISPREDGRFYLEDFLNVCDEKTCIISMMLVNNETGHILPVGETFKAVKKRFPEIITHCDCVQGYMKVPVNVKNLSADMISLSGHKIHAVKGVGALYIKKGIRVTPVVTGGHQEKGIRSGTESVPLISAFGSAVEKYAPTIAERYEKVSGLKRHLLDGLLEIDGVTINSPENASPYVVNISAGKRSEIMLHFMEQKEIYVSSGSACSKGQQSGVLGQFGIKGKNADSALRISMTADTTTEELDVFIDALREGMEKIRG